VPPLRVDSGSEHLPQDRERLIIWEGAAGQGLAARCSERELSPPGGRSVLEGQRELGRSSQPRMRVSSQIPREMGLARGSPTRQTAWDAGAGTQGWESRSWVLPLTHHHLGARTPGPKLSPSLFQIQGPKAYSSLQATSQQPSPGGRLCFLIKSKSGRDKEQQQSPRGNHALPSPGPGCPGFSGCFSPVARHHRRAASIDDSSRVPNSSCSPSRPPPTHRASLSLLACKQRCTGRYRILLPLTDEPRLCTTDVGPGLRAEHCSPACRCQKATQSPGLAG